MKNIIRTILICIIATSSFAQNNNYEKGLKAFDSKEYLKALKLLQPYADSGDSIAQFVTGYCYYNKELGIKNDSIAEFYLTKSAERKYGRAMGLLSVIYFEKSMKDSKYKIDALVWAEIAAVYDPIQKGITTRYLIKAHMSEAELKEVENILKNKKKDFDKIDIQNFLSSSFVNDKSNLEKTKISENTLGLIEDPYRDWVDRWKYEGFECDTMYYTKKINSFIIDSTISKIENNNKFKLWSLYSGPLSKDLVLTSEEQLFLIEELKKLRDFEWNKDLFPYSKRLDNTEIETTFQITENLSTEKQKNMCSIVYSFSKPIYLRNKSLCLFLDQKRYRTNYTQLSFSFYVFENNRWEELAVVYKYYESQKNKK